MKYRATMCGMVTGPRGPLKPWKNKWGYLQFSKKVDGKNKAVTVHSLVAETFLGPRPEGLVIDHINGNREDNRVCNLRYVSPYENVVYGKGCKLTQEDASFIRSSNGLKQQELADMFNISQPTVSNIQKGKTHNDY